MATSKFTSGHLLARRRSQVHRMSKVVPDTQQEFWRPPVTETLVTVPAAPTSPNIAAVICMDCQTEFMSGSNFCYVCGATRATETHWHDRFIRIFGFHHIKHALGLSVPSLVGFFAGMACLIAALSVGWAISAQTTAEFQAVQLLRIEWLLGSVAAFLAGILLKHIGEE